MIRIHYLQHVPCDDSAGSVGAWALERGHALSTTRLYAGEPLPDPDAFDLLVIFGGPMNTDEEEAYPWLAAEKRFISRSIAAGRAVLGLCLGAQMVAAALGARVRRNSHPEIGWFPITWTPEAHEVDWLAGLPNPMPVLHWHGDVVDLSPEMQLLAFSAGCPVQAFSAGSRVLGLQFHLETTPADLARLHKEAAPHIVAGPWTQSADAILEEQRFFTPNRQAMYTILDGLARECGTGRQEQHQTRGA